MHIGGVEDENYKRKKIDFWKNVYGVDMSCIRPWALMEPVVDEFDKEGIISDYNCF